MKYRTFTDKCVNGAEVTDGNRNGIIIKKSQNNEKALVSTRMETSSRKKQGR